MRKDDARLEDINNAAIRLAEYVAGVALERFLEDNMRKAATIREIVRHGVNTESLADYATSCFIPDHCASLHNEADSLQLGNVP